MSDDHEQGYRRQVVRGLPASLLEREGKTFTVIALMQRKAGLNRERRRAMGGNFKLPAGLNGRIDPSLPRSELNVLGHYLGAGHRFGSFWSVMDMIQKRRHAEGTKAYSVAIDVQLLNAYETAWATLELDEAVLAETCPEWPNIRKQIEDGASKDLEASASRAVHALA